MRSTSWAVPLIERVTPLVPAAIPSTSRTISRVVAVRSSTAFAIVDWMALMRSTTSSLRPIDLTAVSNGALAPAGDPLQAAPYGLGFAKDRTALRDAAHVALRESIAAGRTTRSSRPTASRPPPCARPP